MRVADKASRTSGPFYRNLISGLVGLAAVASFIVASIRCQDCLDAKVLAFSVYVFPMPVGIGLAVGLVSPRKSIVWAPFWACILTMLTFAVMSGEIGGNEVRMSTWRVVFTFAGVILAGLGGLAGKLANERNYAWQSAALVVLVCCAMGLVGRWYVFDSERDFVDSHLPRMVVSLNHTYMSVPNNLHWHRQRNSSLSVYVLKSRLKGRDISVTVNAQDFNILGVEYEIEGNGANIKDHDQARDYLVQCGFSDKLLASLAKQGGERPFWSASVEGTRLTLTSTGDVRLDAVDEPVSHLPKRK